MTSITRHETVNDLAWTIESPIDLADIAIASVVQAAEREQKAIPYERGDLIDTMKSVLEDAEDITQYDAAAGKVVQDIGEDFDAKEYHLSGNSTLRKGPRRAADPTSNSDSGVPGFSGPSAGGSGAGTGSGDAPSSAGTMADFKTQQGRGQGDLSANVQGDTEASTSAGTMADYKERQARQNARPARIVDSDDLRGNSLSAHKEREAADTVHVIGTLASDDAGRLKTNAAGQGDLKVRSLQSSDSKDTERVRITDEPGDEVRIYLDSADPDAHTTARSTKSSTCWTTIAISKQNVLRTPTSHSSPISVRWTNGLLSGGSAR